MSALTSLFVLAALAAPSDSVLVQFTSQQCTHCQAMQPVLQRLADDGCQVQVIDVDQQPDLAGQFRVTGVPTFVALTSGRETGRIVGATSYDRLAELSRGQAQPAAAATAPSLNQAAPSLNQTAGSFPTPAAGAIEASSPAARVPTHFASTQAGNSPPVKPAAYQVTAAANPVGGNSQQAAMAASVRLKVEDGKGFGFGTGTIIDAHDQEALIVTCGHIFRDSEGKGPISVDLFAPGGPQSVPGTLLAYDLERDVALVSIKPGIAIQPVSVAAPGTAVRPGDPIFTIGCDKGADASIRESKITAVNKYLGRPNYTAAGAPIDGRSGGGLFAADGSLIGVCNAADPADDEGLYAALASIHWQLDQIGQSEIYQRRAVAANTVPANAIPVHPVPVNTATVSAASADLPADPVAVAEPSLPALPPAMPGREFAVTPPASLTPSLMPAASAEAAVAPGLVNAPVAAAPLANAADDTEIVFIVRSKRNPEQRSEVYVVDQATPQLMTQISDAARATGQRKAAAVTASRAAAGAAPGLAQRQRAAEQPVVRGQSEY